MRNQEHVMSIIKKLYKNGHITLEQSFPTETSYECIMGSQAYNVAEDKSDMDIHSFTIPPIEYVFPHVSGYINGFGPAPPKFETFQQHNVIVNEKNYDVVIYSIVKLFQLAAENNPNVLDMLWVPENCILSIDGVGTYIRQNRKHFLHKGSYHKFRGYSYAQLKKLTETPRKELVEKYGFDTKHAYHIIRLAYQCQQILEEGDMDITRNSEMLKSIRRGEWTLERIKERFYEKEKELDELYTKSSLAYSPNWKHLTNMLMACIEMKHGSISAAVNQSETMAFKKLEDIRRIVNS